MQRVLGAAIVSAVIVATMIVGTVQAKGKPPRGDVAPAASVTLNQVDPHLGDWVTFSYSADVTGGKDLRIEVMCRRDGQVVYGEAGPAGQSFLLGGAMSTWYTTGGAAECVATLYYWDFHPAQTFVALATTSFHAGSWR